VSPKQPTGRAGSGLRIAGVVIGSLAVAALGTGLILNLKVNNMTKDLEKPDNFSRDTDSSRKDLKTLGWASYGIGAAFLAGGSVLYYFGWRSSLATSRSDVAIRPILMSGSAGLWLRGTF